MLYIKDGILPSTTANFVTSLDNKLMLISKVVAEITKKIIIYECLYQRSEMMVLLFVFVLQILSCCTTLCSLVCSLCAYDLHGGKKTRVTPRGDLCEFQFT